MTRRKWGPLPARLLWVCVLLAGGIALAFMLPLPRGFSVPPQGNYAFFNRVCPALVE